jgi:hypothetical protein
MDNPEKNNRETIYPNKKPAEKLSNNCSSMKNEKDTNREKFDFMRGQEFQGKRIQVIQPDRRCK